MRGTDCTREGDLKYLIHTGFPSSGSMNAPSLDCLQEHDDCPKCKVGCLERVIHRYGDGGQSAPDCSWLICLDCDFRTDPE